MPDQNQETLPTNKIFNKGEKTIIPLQINEQKKLPRFILDRISDIKESLTHNPSNPERALEKIAVLDLPQEKENLDRPIDHDTPITQGLLSNDGEQLVGNLGILHQLPVREAATALARMTRENHSEAMVNNAYSIIDSLRISLDRQRGEAGRPLNLTAEETAAIADFFSGLREMLPLIQPNDLESYVIPLYTLLRENRELSVMAADIVGDLLMNKDRIREGLELVRQLPTREAATALARMARENHSKEATFYIDGAIRILRRNLIRRRSGEAGAPLSLTAEETAAVADFFSGLREMLPRIRENGYESCVARGFEGLLRDNRELLVMATDLMGDLLMSNNPNQLRENLKIVEKQNLPIRETIGLLNRMIRTNPHSHNLTCNIDNVVEALEFSLYRQRGEAGAPLGLTAEETAAVADFFSGLREMLPRIRENGHWGNLAFSLNTLLEYHPELASLASDLVTEIWVTPAEDLTKELLKLTPEFPQSEIDQLIAEGEIKIIELLQAIKRVHFLGEILTDFTPAERKDLLIRLNKLAKGKYGQVRMRIIRHIFDQTSSEGQSFLSMLQEEQLNFDISKLPEVFNDQAVYDLISVLADNPQTNKFQLALLLSQTSLTHMPQTLREKLKPILADMEFKIKPEHGGWWLCDMAEPRLMESMQNTAVVLVNGSLLVKFDGKFTALCLQTTTTKEGYAFLEGTWYSPVDKATREAIKDSFDQGRAKLTLEQAEWALMRPLEQNFDSGQSAEEILRQAREFAQSLGDRLPDTIGEISREEYREAKREGG